MQWNMHWGSWPHLRLLLWWCEPRKGGVNMEYDPEPANLLHEAVETVCERNPQLVLMPYDQIKQAALELARQVIALRKCMDGN